MRVLSLLVLVLLGTLLFGADTRKSDPQPDERTRGDTIRAATGNAVRNLYEEVGRLPLAGDLTIRAYLNNLKVEEEFMKTLQGAEQVGDPRWVNHTCQVQLEIPAARISYALRQIAAAYPKSPLNDNQIEKAARNWPQAVFSATGSAACKGADIRPRAGSRWTSVPAEARQRALDDAANDAARRVMASVREIPLGDRKSVGDAFADPQISDRVRGWLTSRPMTRVDFQESLDVEVALAADSRELFDVFRQTLEGQDRFPVPKTPEDWREIEKDFLARSVPAVGRAKVADPKVAPVVNMIRLPQRPPVWIEKSISVVGSSKQAGGKLKTARAAERDAQAKLTERIESLELDSNLTVGQAARQDPRIAAAISRTLERINPHKVQYNPDGSVTVHVEVELRDLWEQLRH